VRKRNPEILSTWGVCTDRKRTEEKLKTGRENRDVKRKRAILVSLLYREEERCPSNIPLHRRQPKILSQVGANQVFNPKRRPDQFKSGKKRTGERLWARYGKRR